ncbi:MAG TPA: chemotaxis protein CheD [Dongiaceae bacterium]|nr:chemotaxis protein CheD [Dongiaceae bacterium]
MAANTTWVIPPPKKSLVVGVADMIASNDPSAEIVTYSLGSCLGVTVYDPQVKVGGLLHLMLPDSAINASKAMTSPYMFVDTGVPRLFQSVFQLGGDRRRLIVKVAGGAQLLDQQGVFNIGERNFRTFSELLAQRGYTVQARDVGGLSSRTLRLEMATGKVTIKCPGVDLYAL